MLANVCTGAIKGIEGFAVSVEVDIAPGMPTLAVVGLPDAEVRESKERVVAAVRNSGFDFPTKRITVNLSPAELRKSGTQFDLPIALGILAASEQLSPDAAAKIKDLLVLGELALDGSLRPCAGVLPMLISCKKLGKTAVIPPQNVLEGQVSGAPFITPHTLKELAGYLEGKLTLQDVKLSYVPQEEESPVAELDFSEVKGQALAKRALEIAAAFFGVIPEMSLSHSGWFSITSKVSMPKRLTIFSAVTGPTPFTVREERYFRISSTASGRRFSKERTASCLPYSAWYVQ